MHGKDEDEIMCDIGEGEMQYDREISKSKRGRLVYVFGNGLFGSYCELSACVPSYPVTKQLLAKQQILT